MEELKGDETRFALEFIDKVSKRFEFLRMDLVRCSRFVMRLVYSPVCKTFCHGVRRPRSAGNEFMSAIKFEK